MARGMALLGRLYNCHSWPLKVRKSRGKWWNGYEPMDCERYAPSGEQVGPYVNIFGYIEIDVNVYRELHRLSEHFS